MATSSGLAPSLAAVGELDILPWAGVHGQGQASAAAGERSEPAQSQAASPLLSSRYRGRLHVCIDEVIKHALPWLAGPL